MDKIDAMVERVTRAYRVEIIVGLVAVAICGCAGLGLLVLAGSRRWFLPALAIAGGLFVFAIFGGVLVAQAWRRVRHRATDTKEYCLGYLATRERQIIRGRVAIWILTPVVELPFLIQVFRLRDENMLIASIAFPLIIVVLYPLMKRDLSAIRAMRDQLR